MVCPVGVLRAHTGRIPSQLSALVKIIMLGLDGNQLTGEDEELSTPVSSRALLHFCLKLQLRVWNECIAFSVGLGGCAGGVNKGPPLAHSTTLAAGGLWCSTRLRVPWLASRCRQSIGRLALPHVWLCHELRNSLFCRWSMWLGRSRRVQALDAAESARVQVFCVKQ